MQRRQFLQNLAWITGGLVTSSYLPASVLIGKKKKIKGSVLSGGKGIANVVVSDGYHVVRTDKKGKYELDIHAEAVAVFVSTPSGYAFTNQKSEAQLCQQGVGTAHHCPYRCGVYCKIAVSKYRPKTGTSTYCCH